MTYHTNLPDNIADWLDEQDCYREGVWHDGPSLIHRLSDKYGSLRKLCQVCGFSKTYLSRISTGKEIMSFRCYLKLAALDGWRRGGR